MPEIAAGTGVVTRELARQLPPTTAIIATALNDAMIGHAATLPIERPVEWRTADAQTLPFDDASFDLRRTGITRPHGWRRTWSPVASRVPRHS